MDWIRLLLLLLCIMSVAGCGQIDKNEFVRSDGQVVTCLVTEPEWVKPPEDPAISGSPDYGYYYSNADSSIWASAWWAEQDEVNLQAGDVGVKVGWFRPEGAEILITGDRLDDQSAPMESEVPCCYPTRFQSSGLFFPTEGCWQIKADSAGETLSFVVWVAPER